MPAQLYQADAILWGLAFIIGLYLGGSPWGWVIALVLGLLMSFCRNQAPIWPKFWRSLPPDRSWLIATGIALIAMAYMFLRTPTPGATDISRVVTRLTAMGGEPTVMVEGNVQTYPLPNRAGKLRFFLEAERYQHVPGRGGESLLQGRASGRLYVTIDAKDGADIRPGQTIAVTGFLYQPKAGGNQFYRAFNFQRQLQLEHTFAGLAGRQAKILKAGSPWGLWALRERIFMAQGEKLGAEQGPLLSAMLLGSRAVGVPFDIRDAFRRVGLSHAIAASGFHTSVILGVVMLLTRPLPKNRQLQVGGAALILFAALSGFAPSAVRAVLMGLAGLAALSGETKTQPASLLLAIAVGMLIVNPLWSEDLGFQLSFLATLGLIVSAPAIEARLSWLPGPMANLMAIPLAANIWVFPLSLAIFGVFPTYGLIVNVITTFLLSVVTVGSFISGLGAVLWPTLGGLLAWVMYYPIVILLWLVDFFGSLPYSLLALGALGWTQVFAIYGLILLVWLHPWWQKRWVLALGTSLSLVIVPFLLVQTNTFRVTVLDNTQTPIMVIQQPGGNVVINSGDLTSAGTSLGSFLAAQGINQIHWAIATTRQSQDQGGWADLAKITPIIRLSEVPTASSDPDYREMLTQLPTEKQSLRLDQEAQLGDVAIKLLRADPAVIQMQIKDKKWLLITEPPRSLGQSVWLRSANLPRPDVLWWWGRKFDPNLLDILQPQALVLTTAQLSSGVQDELKSRRIPFYWSGQDGAVQWQPSGKFLPNQSTGDSGL
ncbi:ComEC/Rec2 family competence protein [Thermosynechococcaceae cyanobacterium BACA0444]|uniref:ComEC/Rec2 family competence protein n=1 Tax=Pseudocalidococcus azoricus BACA0444 TaxID=2918990 RepID=A0AAE4FU98_9CYAN|nr:ComEC/Rec2 family competence protein [Pseudocalidococcus azoricus]MDS3861519.1 ComEC/Rec2 family competence protein [Pseudocalidococcus azoricus BACA0444]